MAGLIRRKIPPTEKTQSIAARWGKSDRHVRRLLNKYGAKSVRTSESPNATACWVKSDVERVEKKLFGNVL